ncbi:27897_t:CDS:2, partial [Gigaspora margarita]
RHNVKEIEMVEEQFEKNLEDGLEYLPTKNLKHFDCDGTIYADTLKEFKTDYPVYFGDMWKEVVIKEFDKLLKTRDEFNEKIEVKRLTSASETTWHIALARERTKQLKEMVVELKNG